MTAEEQGFREAHLAFDLCMAGRDPTQCLDQWEAVKAAWWTWFWRLNGEEEGHEQRRTA